MPNLVTARNTVSGQVDLVPESYLDHPVLGKTLEKVPEGTKSRHPELHAETDVDGKNADGKQVRTPKKHVDNEGEVPPADPKPASTVN